jgi:hypothetical protein
MRFGEFLAQMRDKALMRSERPDGKVHLLQRLFNLMDHIAEEGVDLGYGDFRPGARAWIKYWLREAVLRDTAFAADATTDFLDFHGSIRRLPRFNKGYAKYDETFGRNVGTHPNGDIFIPCGIIVSDGGTLRYRTIDFGLMPHGTYSIKVPIRAEQRGVDYNLGTATIETLVTAVPGIDTCSNLEGDQLVVALDVESGDAYRTRLLNAFATIRQWGRKQGVEEALAAAGVDAEVIEHYTDYGTYGPQAKHWASFSVLVDQLGGHFDCQEFLDMVRKVKPAYARFYPEIAAGAKSQYPRSDCDPAISSDAPFDDHEGYVRGDSIR